MGSGVFFHLQIQGHADNSVNVLKYLYTHMYIHVHVYLRKTNIYVFTCTYIFIYIHVEQNADMVQMS